MPQLPTVEFDPKATVLARKSVVVFKKNGGTETLNLICQKIEIEAALDFAENKVPKGKYIIKNRKVPKEKKFIVKAEVGDVKVPLDFFGTLPFSETGTAEVFICDPDDASGKVSVHLKPFACNASNEGTMSFEGENFAKNTISFEALDNVDIEIDASIA